MTVKGGTSPACAACKYQRRKCISTCPLAPYFPANDPKMFQNVHRLFGVSNVTKLIEKLETKEEKDDAMTSIIYEADMRERYPVHGCCTVIGQLRQQVYLAMEQLRWVESQLELCRQEQSGPDWPTLRRPTLAQLADDAFQKQEIMPPGGESMPFAFRDHELYLSNKGFLNEENMVKPLRNFDNSRNSAKSHVEWGNSAKMKIHPNSISSAAKVKIHHNFDEDSSSVAEEKIHHSNWDGMAEEKIHHCNWDGIEEEMDRFGIDEKCIYPEQDFEAIYLDNYTNSSAEKSYQDNYTNSSAEKSSLESLEDSTKQDTKEEDQETRNGCRREDGERCHGCRREDGETRNRCRKELKTAAAGLSLTTVTRSDAGERAQNCCCRLESNYCNCSRSN